MNYRLLLIVCLRIAVFELAVISLLEIHLCDSGTVKHGIRWWLLEKQL